jgi:HEAT repeat protein
MIARFNRLHSFVGIVASLAFGVAAGHSTGESTLITAQNRVEPLLRSVAVGKKLGAEALDRISDLIAVVEKGDAGESELAVRALATMGSRASPAIEAISEKLQDPSHATRSVATDALVAIGEKCVGPLRILLNSPTGRTRAAATDALARLKSLDLDDLGRLAKDADPRVRATTARALSLFGKPGVPLLIKLLQDSELAVAAEAARVLGINRDDVTIAVPALMKALPRADLGGVAVAALSAYGMGAKQAIPAIIKAYPLGPSDSPFLDACSAALEHIGPPDVKDIPELCTSLGRDEETRMVVAKCVARLGLDGRSAADALEAAAEKSIKDYIALERAPEAQRRNSGRLWAAGEKCVTAVWEVTHDSARLLRLVERLAIMGDAPIFGYYSHSMPLTELSEEDCQYLERMLRHSNVHVQQTALVVLADVGENAEPLMGVVLELAQGRDAELSRNAVRTLAAMGANVGNNAAPILIARLQDSTIPLQQFADAVGRMKIRVPATLEVLERGLHDKDQWTATACATALCITASEPDPVARLVIDAARAGSFTERRAIESLTRLKGGDDVVIPFLIQQLKNADYWTRHDAIDALGALGGRAVSATSLIESQLHDESAPIRLKAAAAIFSITDDARQLQEQLDAVYAKDELAERYHAMRTLAELQRLDGRFVRYPLNELRRSPPELVEESIEALQANGTNDAVAALQTVASSSDWALRSQANKALRQLNHLDDKKGN